MTNPLKRVLIALATVFATAFASIGIVLAPAVAPVASPVAPTKAAASAFWITVNHKSLNYVHVYNKSGCLGATNSIPPGHSSSTDHLWKTLWVPKHKRMHFLDLQSGYHYYVDNPHSYKTCHSAGRYYSLVGWEVWTSAL